MQYPASMLVRTAVDDFLARHGFARSEYAARWYFVRIAGLKIWLPNPPSRRRMVPLHDLHHVATGYDVDLRGEAEIGAWELGAGCTTPTLWLINGAAALIGLCVAPRRTLRAFRAGRAARTLYALEPGYSDLLELTVGELRRHLRLSEQGEANAE
jgi:hypothetical protein